MNATCPLPSPLDNYPFTIVRAASYIGSEKNKLLLGPFLTRGMQQMGSLHLSIFIMGGVAYTERDKKLSRTTPMEVNDGESKQEQ